MTHWPVPATRICMKELQFAAADGEWRVAFAFDLKRKAILLVAEG